MQFDDFEGLQEKLGTLIDVFSKAKVEMLRRWIFERKAEVSEKVKAFCTYAPGLFVSHL